MNWLNNIKLSTKMMILGMLIVITIGVPTSLFLKVDFVLINALKQELKGIDPERRVLEIEGLIQEHRAMSAMYLNGDSRIKSELEAKSDSVNAKLVEFQYYFENLVPNSTIKVDLDNVSNKFSNLSKTVNANNILPDASFSGHTDIIQIVNNSVIPYISEYFGQRYDPAPETYHLIISSSDDFIKLLEGVERIRGIGSGLLTSKNADVGQISQLQTAINISQDAINTLKHNIRVAIASSNNTDVQELEIGLQEVVEKFSVLSRRAINEIINKQELTYSAEKYFSETGKVISDYHVFSNHISSVLKNRLDEKVSEAEWVLYDAAFIVTGLILTSLILGIFIVRSVIKGVAVAVKTANGIRDENFDHQLDTARKDELGQLFDALTAMAKQLKRAAEEARSNYAIKQAVDNSGTAIMMSGTDHNVFYANMAARNLLKDSEADIKQWRPEFDVEQLAGNSLGDFYQPEEAGKFIKVLDALKEKTDSQMSIGERIFNLSANPVCDIEGKNTGSFVEWKEITESLKIQKETTRVLESLNCTSTNVMIADADRKIIYTNRGVEKMLQDCEADLRVALPHFNAATVLGSNIDIFHKNPAHQSKLLDQLQESFTSQIKVGRRHFRLIANPIIGNDGQRLGSVVEWLDRTIEIEAEQEIGRLVSAASQGDFSERVALDDKSGFMRVMAEALNQLVETADTGLNDVARVLLALSKGDLTQKIEANYSGTFDQLKEYSNQTTANLAHMIGEIRTAADTINNASTEIAQGNADLSNRTEQQAASLEETASSMEELTGTVRLNADNAKQANVLASKASEVASDGGDLIQKVVLTMASINESSQKIADIIGVIDGIAFQTNILALNAAVEAARAGEQGRGFAVVASEVRTLAQRSANAAKDIKALISDSVSKIADGNSLVGKSGETMEEIVTSIKRVNDIMSEIAAASSEQSAGIDEIGKAVSQMDSMTQQNAALVEEAAASAESMQTQAVQLASRVSTFKLDDMAPQSMAEAVPVASHQIGHQQQKAAPKPLAKAAKASSAPILKSKVLVAEDEWEEF